MIVRCTTCKTEATVACAQGAAELGWAFLQLQMAHGNKYGVFCPEHTRDAGDFVRGALAGPKARKGKQREGD